ncbi:hypothetical protein AN1V17_32090 [Vallitalea sediminicola]
MKKGKKMIKKYKKWILYILLIFTVLITFLINPKFKEYKFDKYEQRYLKIYIAILDSCKIDDLPNTLVTSQNEEYMKKIESLLQEMNSLNPSNRFFDLSSANFNYDELKLCMDTLKDKESLDDTKIKEIKPIMVKAKAIAELTLKERVKN